MTRRVQTWLARATAVSLLHVFDHALNLSDDEGNIISVVQPSIGPGPFAIVVETERPFTTIISPDDPVKPTAVTLKIGSLQINLSAASLWQPVPPWETIHQSQREWRTHLPALQTAVDQHQERLTSGGPANFVPQFLSAASNFGAALSSSDTHTLAKATADLAGLGPGFTPAGDDFLLGAMLGLWATRSEAEVVDLAKIVLETAVPRTTLLSTAWLKTAAQGEAAQPWHNLFNAFLQESAWQSALNTILNTGATSGTAALMGFITATSTRPNH